MEPILSLRAIKKAYGSGESEVQALRGVSLDVMPGDFVALMGPSGSGKSTLMNLIGCLDQPSQGSYMLAGRDVSRQDRNALAEIRNRTLGFVFQSFNLLPRTTAVENVELPMLYAGVPARERHARAVAALERVGLAARVAHRPNELSGGQQQRVAIARAIVTQPQVLLADEPTGNLDSRTSLEIMALFQDLGKSGITVVLVTHEPDIAEFASRVIVLRDGLLDTDRRQAPRDAQLMLAGERP